jgi:hypothetical protein
MGKFPHEETRTKEKQIGENELLVGEMTWGWESLIPSSGRPWERRPRCSLPKMRPDRNWTGDEQIGKEGEALRQRPSGRRESGPGRERLCEQRVEATDEQARRSALGGNRLPHKSKNSQEKTRGKISLEPRKLDARAESSANEFPGSNWYKQIH